MASSTVEDYLKHIYMLQQRQLGRRVAMGKLANAVRVAPGTTTSMIKTLASSGLVDYEPRSGVKLTTSGEQLALHVLRRHRLVELFLVRVLNLDWSAVHDEAERLEHAISDTVIEKIDALLGQPRFDPHGDPIPTAKGSVDHARLVSLIDCPVGRSARIARIVDQDAGFLQFADRHGLTPGIDLIIDRRDDHADSITMHSNDREPVTIGRAAADKIFVEYPQ